MPKYEDGKLHIKPGDSFWVVEEDVGEFLFSVQFADGERNENNDIPLEMIVYPMHLNDIAAKDDDVTVLPVTDASGVNGARIVCH